MSVWLLILVGWLAMAGVMASLWVVQRRTGDAGIVDVAWGMGVGLLAVYFAAFSEGNATRRVLVATLAMVWAIRLSLYILTRLIGMAEDGRYQNLKQQWGGRAQHKLFWFYQFQAVGSVLFAIPMLIASRSTQPLGTWDLIGTLVWLVAIAGESVSDRQLARFRSEPNNRGRVCRSGLWRYSRHPNYFFEWLHWWSYVCFAAASPWGWLTIVGPLAMLYFILFVTGIPPTEEQALKSRGDAYRDYQRTTSSFIPWLPKKTSAI